MYTITLINTITNQVVAKIVTPDLTDVYTKLDEWELKPNHRIEMTKDIHAS